MSKHVSTESSLAVRDAKSLKVFLKKAAAVWRRAHGVIVRTPGRPGEGARGERAFQAVVERMVDEYRRAPEAAALAAQRRSLNTDAVMIARTRAELVRRDEELPSEATLKKWIKLFRLHRRGAHLMTESEWQWLKKHQPGREFRLMLFEEPGIVKITKRVFV